MGLNTARSKPGKKRREDKIKHQGHTSARIRIPLLGYSQEAIELLEAFLPAAGPRVRAACSEAGREGMAVEFDVDGLEFLPGHVLEFAMVLAEGGRLSSKATSKETPSDPFDLAKNPAIDAIRARAEARAAARAELEGGEPSTEANVEQADISKKTEVDSEGDEEDNENSLEDGPGRGDRTSVLDLSKKQHAAEFAKALIVVGLAAVRSSFSMSAPTTLAVMASVATGGNILGKKEKADGKSDEKSGGTDEGATSLASLSAQTRTLFMTIAMASSRQAAVVFPRTSATPAEFLSASARHLTPVSGVSASTSAGAGTSTMEKRTVIIQAAFGGVNLHRLPSLAEGYKDKEVYLRPAMDDGGSGARLEKETARWRKRGAAEIVIEVDGEGIETLTLIGILASSGVLKKFSDVEAGRHQTPPATGTIRVSEWVSGRGGIMVSLAGDSIDRKAARPLMKARRII